MALVHKVSPKGGNGTEKGSITKSNNGKAEITFLDVCYAQSQVTKNNVHRTQVSLQTAKAVTKKFLPKFWHDEE